MILTATSNVAVQVKVINLKHEYPGFTGDTNYSKTKDVYAEYRKSGYSKKFFEEHREAITLCKAAKEVFSNIEGKLPKIKDLNQEYNEVLQEKKKTYAEYRQAKQDMKDIQMAKYNIDLFLKNEEQEKTAEKQKTNEQTL